MYNVNDWIRLSAGYSYCRRGENIYDADGNLIKNVGGDIFLSHKNNPENKTAIFLDGIRFGTEIIEAGIRLEPMRDFIFDITLNYSSETNITDGKSEDLLYGLLKFTLEY